MARTRTRLQLRDEIRVATDTVNDTHVTDAQINVWLDQDVAAFHAMLVRADPMRFRVQTNFATTAGTREYTNATGIPNDFHSMIAMDFLRGDEIYPIAEYKFEERTFGPDHYVDALGVPGVRWEIYGQDIDGTGTTLRFDRDPGTNTYRLHYVRQPTLLTTDGTLLDGVGGWEEWVVHSVCERVAIRQETDPTPFSMLKAKIERDIEVDARKRRHLSPGKISDTTRRRRYGAYSWRT